jgi:hypothetical protein
MTSEESFGADAWAAFLTRELGRPVVVTLGRARRDVLVVRPEKDGLGLRVRLSAVFTEAPSDVRVAVARWLRSGRRARRAAARLDAWIEEVQPRLPRRRVDVDRLRTSGAHHDLEPLRAELLASAFRGPEREAAAGVHLTWGRAGRRRFRRSLRLGSYDDELRLVRIHPALDQAAVPAFVVRSVLHHELLHAVLPNETDARGRVLHHGRGFRRRERAHTDYERAFAWQEQHLPALLRSADTGTPMKVAIRPPRAERATGQLTLFAT